MLTILCKQPVRDFAFSDHHMSYAGATACRALVRTSDALDVKDMLPEVIFWHGTDSKWVYTCPLGGDTFEITCQIIEGKDPEGDGQRLRGSWGHEASVSEFVAKYSEFCPPVKQILHLVTGVQQYDFFAGLRLKRVVARGSVALVGDASHPLSGAFGAGAGFALEDAFTLAGSLAWAFRAGSSSSADTHGRLSAALSIYDGVCSPHYADLYGILDGYGRAEQHVAVQELNPKDEIRTRIESVWDPKNNWIYHYEVHTRHFTPLSHALFHISQFFDRLIPLWQRPSTMLMRSWVSANLKRGCDCAPSCNCIPQVTVLTSIDA
jgi:salicylate hydroxylase